MQAGAAGGPEIPLPPALYEPERRNSPGVEFGDRASLEKLVAEAARRRWPRSGPLIDGGSAPGSGDRSIRPSTAPLRPRRRRRRCARRRGHAGRAREAFPFDVGDAPLPRTRRRPIEAARPPDRADEARGGQDPHAAVAEVSEAVDFSATTPPRRALLGRKLPGPTGETDELSYRGRGVLVCIALEFPAFDLSGPGERGPGRRQRGDGQAGGADAADCGAAVRFLYEAGSRTALHLYPATARSARSWSGTPVAGVVFTGSTAPPGRSTARLPGGSAIVTLMAETGGINPMIVDARPCRSRRWTTHGLGFRQAGQRCSALRLLCVQEDVADRVIEMIAGAARSSSSATRATRRAMSGP